MTTWTCDKLTTANHVFVLRRRNWFGLRAIALIAAMLPASLYGIEPEIHADRSATFRIQAPDAERVAIDVKGRTSRDNQPVEMTKDESGVWSYTSPPLDPGFHYYFVFINGFRCADSENPLYFGWRRLTNGIDIPDPELTCYLPRRVPRGEIRIRPYFSELTGRWREAYVYTPPGYDQQLERRFPVLYLQHGAGENQTSWSVQGRANTIMDNLLADGNCEPMLIVMDYGYADPPNSSGSNDSSLFGRVVIEELIPVIEAHYRVHSDRRFRALAGLSRGGGQALQIGLSHLDTFAYIGCMSGAARDLAVGSGETPDPQTINSKLKLLWMACGTEDFVIERAEGLHRLMEEQGIRHEFVAHPGTHEWQAWRRQLHLFAPRLFHQPSS